MNEKLKKKNFSVLEVHSSKRLGKNDSDRFDYRSGKEINFQMKKEETPKVRESFFPPLRTICLLVLGVCEARLHRRFAATR